MTARTGEKAAGVAMTVQRHGSTVELAGQLGLCTSAVNRGCAIDDRFMADFAQRTGLTVRMDVEEVLKGLTYREEVALGLGCFDLDTEVRSSCRYRWML